MSRLVACVIAVIVALVLPAAVLAGVSSERATSDQTAHAVVWIVPTDLSLLTPTGTKYFYRPVTGLRFVISQSDIEYITGLRWSGWGSATARARGWSRIRDKDIGWLPKRRVTITLRGRNPRCLGTRMLYERTEVRRGSSKHPEVLRSDIPYCDTGQ